MYYQQCPFYDHNMNQIQIPPYMRAEKSPVVTIPIEMEPESTMPEYQLETMYPKTYFIIYNEVVLHTDMFDKECCSMKLPTHEEIERMVDSICIKVEADVEAAINPEMREVETRQMGFHGRRLLRDFARAFLLREFFHRRHRPHRRRFPHHMGY